MKNLNPSLRHRVLNRLGAVGLALIVSLAIPAASEKGSIAVSEASAQEPAAKFQLGFWGVQICVGDCVAGYGVCCDEVPHPLL